MRVIWRPVKSGQRQFALGALLYAICNMYWGLEFDRRRGQHGSDHKTIVGINAYDGNVRIEASTPAHTTDIPMPYEGVSCFLTFVFILGVDRGYPLAFCTLDEYNCTHYEDSKRTSLPSTTLFGKARREVLTVLFGNADQAFYIRQLARLTGLGMGALQRELAALSEAGIIERAKQGNHIFLKANAACPIYQELKGIVAKTVGF